MGLEFNRRLDTPYYKKLHGLNFSQLQDKLKDFCLNHENYSHTRHNPNTHHGVENWWNIYPDPDPDFLKNHPYVQEFFDQFNLTVGSFAFFFCSNKVSAIHVDQPDVPSKWGVNTQTRINIPVINCEGSTTRYYISQGDQILNDIPSAQRGSATDTVIKAGHFKEETCTEVDRFILDVPTLIRVDVPHNVVVEGWRFPRISATIGFYEDPTPLLESKELFRNQTGELISNGC